LGFFPRDRAPQQFGDAAFGASAGDIVGPVETNFGYHVIQVVEKKDEEVMDFKKAKPKARMKLLTFKREQMKDQYVQKLRASAKVDIKTSMY
jgi:peptidyl-prolyl cis-trans isomerase C